MNAVSTLRDHRNRVRWSSVVTTLPPGIHEPKLHGDVGFDLEAMHMAIIPPGESQDVAVNLKLWLPDGYYAEIRNRSSMARRGLYVDANIVDTGYRGPMFVLIRNMRKPTHDDPEPTAKISPRERIAQLLFHRVAPIWLDETEDVPDDTERGSNGFGSTGF